MTCSGPADEIAALRAICTSDGLPFHFDNSVADMSFVVGGVEAGPKLLVLGYFGTSDSSPYKDHRADIRYAAYLVQDTPAYRNDGIYDYDFRELVTWSEGTPVVGEVATETARPIACEQSFVGHATFEIGNVTMDLRFALAVGC